MLAAGTLDPRSGRHDTEPRAIVRFDDVRLVGVTFVGNDGTGGDVAAVGRLGRRGARRREQDQCRVTERGAAPLPGDRQA